MYRLLRTAMAMSAVAGYAFIAWRTGGVWAPAYLVACLVAGIAFGIAREGR